MTIDQVFTATVLVQLSYYILLCIIV